MDTNPGPGAAKYRPVHGTTLEVQDLTKVLKGEMSRKELQNALALKHKGISGKII